MPPPQTGWSAVSSQAARLCGTQGVCHRTWSLDHAATTPLLPPAETTESSSLAAPPSDPRSPRVTGDTVVSGSWILPEALVRPALPPHNPAVPQVFHAFLTHPEHLAFARQCGANVLVSSTAQEAYEMCFLAHACRDALHQPVVHVIQDAQRVGFEMTTLHHTTAPAPAQPQIVAAADPFPDSASRILSHLSPSCPTLHQHGGLLSYAGPKDATAVFVLLPYEARLFSRLLLTPANTNSSASPHTSSYMSSSDIATTTTALTANARIGILTVRALGPFSPRAFASNLPHTVQHLFVTPELFPDATQQEDLPCHPHPLPTTTSTTQAPLPPLQSAAESLHLALHPTTPVPTLTPPPPSSLLSRVVIFSKLSTSSHLGHILSQHLNLCVAQYESFKNDTLRTELSFSPVPALVPHFQPWDDVDLIVFTSPDHPESTHEMVEIVDELLRRSSPGAMVVYNCQRSRPGDDLAFAVNAKGGRLQCLDFDAYLKRTAGITTYTTNDVMSLAEIIVLHLLSSTFMSKEQALRHVYQHVNPLLAKETSSLEKSSLAKALHKPGAGAAAAAAGTATATTASSVAPSPSPTPPMPFPNGGSTTTNGGSHSMFSTSFRQPRPHPTHHHTMYRPRLGYQPTSNPSADVAAASAPLTAHGGEAYERLLQNLFRDKRDYVMLSTSTHSLETCFGMLLARAPATSGWILVEPNTDSLSDVSSGVHHIVSHQPQHHHSAPPNNVKVVLTTMASTTNHLVGQLGLYAMNYGNSYVASVCVEENHSHAVKALLEADQFQGPAIILACTSKDPKWPLYRWNPHASHSQQYGYGNQQKFNLDSATLQHDVAEFLRHDQQLTLIAKQTPDFSEELNSLDRAAKVKQDELKKHYKQLADALAEAQGRRKGQAGGDGDQANKPDLQLLVLYGSDSGKGASVASRIAEKIEKAGYGETRCLEANEYPLDTLDEEKHVILVLSTAGQGEDCANAKKFCKALMDRTSNLPKSLKFAVFGLGDSSYWGAGTADSARYFCAPSKRLFDKLKKLQATPLVSSCYCGDDRHDDGYETQLGAFEKDVYEALNVQGLSQASEQAHVDDDIKIASNFLRGTIQEGLADLSTGKLVFEDTKITKFHGIYQQDDRDLRDALDTQGKERAYSFMIRIGVPGGVATAEQYLMMDDLCNAYCSGRLKVTTRQAYQVHGVIKKNLKTTMQAINRTCLDTLAACGDVNRNIIANPHVGDGPVYEQVCDLARAIDKHLKPKTGAYAEIWLDKKPIMSLSHSDAAACEEPMYGPTYLPRKFKIAIAVPPRNDVDVFAHCAGFIAIVDPANPTTTLLGYNVTVGGGLGTSHGDKKTYPRLADVMGFVRTKEQCLKVIEAILTVQRDHGERLNRRHARLKYTVEDHGVDWYRAQVEERVGFKLEKPKPFKFETNADRFGWHQARDGKSWSFGMFVENGLIFDEGWTGIQNPNTNLSSLSVPGGNSQRAYKQKSALRELATLLLGGGLVSLTANQNVLLSNIPNHKKPLVQAILDKYRLGEVATVGGSMSAMRLHSMACVALPTCALAFAESQRYLPFLIDKIDVLLERNGLKGEPITIRMTGCPNGCARPYLAEIAMIGKAPGVYNLHLGGGHAGNRLNRIYKEGVAEPEILEILGNLFARYAKERLSPQERFGDFVCRVGIVLPVHHGHSFWAQTREENDVSGGSGTMQLYW